MTLSKRLMAFSGRPQQPDIPEQRQQVVPVIDDRLPAVVQPPPREDRWVAFIDLMDRTLIAGWCCDRERPDHSTAIEVVGSNGKRFTMIAGDFRQDIKDAGYGSGNHGFKFDVSSLALSKDDSFIIRFAESKVAITKEPISTDPQRALLEAALPPSFSLILQRLAAEVRIKHTELVERSELKSERLKLPLSELVF